MSLTPQDASSGNRKPSAKSSARPRRHCGRSDIRIDMGLGLGPRMGNRAIYAVAHSHCVAPQRAGLVIMSAWLPGLAPLGELGLGEIDGQRPLPGVEVDHV